MSNSFIITGPAGAAEISETTTKETKMVHNAIAVILEEQKGRTLATYL
jgi:hypothetical protein